MLTACVTVALFVAVIAAAVRHSTKNDGRQPASSPSEVASFDFGDDLGISDDDPLLTSLARPVYMHSVVPGGVYSGSELRTAIRDDAVVAAHYRDLDQSRLRTEIVKQDRYVHVSYRKGDQIFWTKNKVLLRQGETIVTDGKTQVRARCGNCISGEPLLPTSESEPDVIEFDKLVEAPPTSAEALATPPIALVPAPRDPIGSGLGLASPEAGPITPLTSGRFGNGLPPPLAAQDAGEPAMPADIPRGLSGPPASPNPPGTDLPPFTPFSDLPPPGGDDPPSLVPPEHFPQPELPDLPGPPGDPVAVPEPGTLLLVGCGVLGMIRRLRSRARQRATHSANDHVN